MNLALASQHIYPSLILDIGANVGYWYKEAAALYWPTAEFFLIEGNEECRPALGNLGVRFKIAVLSDTEKEVDFYTMKNCGTATGCSYYREDTPFFAGDMGIPHKVRTQTLDALLKDEVLDYSSLLIKIDCQGAELDILKGGRTTVQLADALIIELAHTQYNIGAPMSWDVIPYITELGFVVKEKLEDVCHPINREQIIQTTVLFTR